MVPLLNPSIPDSYPIYCLSSSVEKTFERLIRTRLEWWAEKNKKSPTISAWLQKEAVALATFVSDIHNCFSENKHIIEANVDLTNAYNNVDISILIDKMIAIGVPIRYNM